VPARSAINELPDELRADLEKRLVQGSFSDYRGLAQWLNDNGYEISKSALQRYGSKFEQRVAQLRLATSQAKAIVDASPDDENAVNDSLMRLTQEKLFSFLIETEVEIGEAVTPAVLAKIARAVADTGRATISQKKWLVEIRAKVEATAATVATIAKKGGLGKGAADQIRREILGITTK